MATQDDDQIHPQLAIPGQRDPALDNPDDIRGIAADESEDEDDDFDEDEDDELDETEDEEEEGL